MYIVQLFLTLFLRHKNINPLFPVLALYSITVNAGGPLFVSTSHQPAAFSNPHIVLHIDPGALGNRTNTQADALLQQAFDVWNQIITSSIQLLPGTDISQDINAGNFNTFLGSPEFINSTDSFIIYDSDGSIIDKQFGVNQSSNTVGFTSTTLSGNQLVRGYSVITGKNTIPGFKTNNDMVITIAHELGHLFGLDHTQTNISNQESATGFPRVCSTRSADQYALMYPFICRSTPSLHADDISAVSALYPATNFNQQYGEIQGVFVDPQGNAILGANIWAENTTTGAVISVVSDYLRQNNGHYQLFVPPGNYTLHANAINPEFIAGSAVGPYASDPTDKSFQPPNPINPVSYQGNTTGNASVITVGSIASTGIITINFTSNGDNGTPVNNGSGGGQLNLFSLLLISLLLWLMRRLNSDYSCADSVNSAVFIN